jgi:pilus assembly protein Flp/PilA
MGRRDKHMTFINMLRDESGASAAEYALILAVVGSGIAVAAITLGTNISNAVTGAGVTIANCGADPATGKVDSTKCK